MKRRHWGIGAAAMLVAACASPSDEVATEDDDLTSLTARQRTLSFEGVVYIEPGATEDAILEAARKQTQSAFGALLASKVAVRTREVQQIDKSSIVKRDVLVIDTAAKTPDKGKAMIEVKYAYRDEAVIPVELARHTSLSLALLAQGSDVHTERVLPDCTLNDKEARDDAKDGLLWYDFNPTKASCRRAIDREQRLIDDDTSKLTDKKTMVSLSRVGRIYLPTAMRLARATTAENATYPEYDKLFAGGADPNALTVTLVNGRLSHEHKEAVKDDGYYEWMVALKTIFAKHPEFELKGIEPQESLSVEVASRKIDVAFKDVIRWTVDGDGFPAGLDAAAKKELASKIAAKLDNHWVTFEKRVKVAIGTAPAKDLTLRIETLFGADEDAEPHRRAVKRGDIVVYNGHSYIGYGPLDPDNFQASGFPSTYQLFFFDSCVSYNYYEKDFFTLKKGGSKALDIITNGLEAPEFDSGKAEGGLIARLLDGSLPSYQSLLKAAKSTDSLRVVDGEIDNTYHPSRVKVRITPR